MEHKNYSSVIAVPRDMYVAGYDSNGVSQPVSYTHLDVYKRQIMSSAKSLGSSR